MSKINLTDFIESIINNNEIANKKELNKVYNFVKDEIVELSELLSNNQNEKNENISEAITKEIFKTILQNLIATYFNEQSPTKINKSNAILKALKNSSKVAKLGFDWSDPLDCIDKIEEELNELKEAHLTKNKINIKNEYGDLLLASINYARMMNISPYEAIENSDDKFLKRFAKLQGIAKQKNIKINQKNISKINAIWEFIKSKE